METYNFNVEKVTEELIQWIKNWFDKNGPTCNAIIGISGGKDSTIAAKLCVEALGKDRVIGVLLPKGKQHDIDVARHVCHILDIQSFETNIREICELFVSIYGRSRGVNHILSEQSLINLPPRIRMAMLRFYAQNYNGRLINTSNFSEDAVGYATIDGDTCGDMSPLSNLTVTEVRAIGHYLGLPAELVDKVPEDGLVGKSDEESIGISYADIDKYLRTGIASPEIMISLDHKYNNSQFKRDYTIGLPKYRPSHQYLYEYTSV